MSDFEGTGIYISDESILRVFMAKRYDFDTNKMEWRLTETGEQLADLIAKRIAARPPER